MNDMSQDEVRDLFREFLGRSELLSSLTVQPIKGPDIELSIMKFTGSGTVCGPGPNIAKCFVQPKRLEVSTPSRDACINWFVTKLEDRARMIVAHLDDPKRLHLVLLRHAVIEEDTHDDGEPHVYMRIFASFAVVEPGNVEVHEVAA